MAMVYEERLGLCRHIWQLLEEQGGLVSTTAESLLHGTILT